MALGQTTIVCDFAARVRRLAAIILRGWEAVPTRLSSHIHAQKFCSSTGLKYCLLVLCWVAVSLTACSTVKTALVASKPLPWSSSDPLSMPYAVRLAQFEKGNLVENPSFEKGAMVTRGTGNTFSLPGWETVGEHVRWVHPDYPGYNPQEVNDGECAIQIVRTKTGEMEAADGIMSDYIPVIPGNYDFRFDVRLKAVEGDKQRLGLRLYDAIVIRILFFDGDLRPVESGQVNPVDGTLIDSSDKSYSFACYWRIDDFPWGTVRGRTYNYPFSEGDVPDRTRYVRLFFGLKGAGTMWLDNIVYRYSKWNFTTLERFKPYLNRNLPVSEAIIPSPKHFEIRNDVNYYDSSESGSHPPLIVLPENPAPAERTAAKVLENKIRGAIAGSVPETAREDKAVRVVTFSPSWNDIHASKLVFSIGRNRLQQTLLPELPAGFREENGQGYLIQSKQIGDAHIVFLIGAAPVATFYAAATALQLLEQGTCVYHDANVIDYPDFLGRSYLFRNWQSAEELQNDLDSMERMSLYKFNKVYLGYKRTGESWHQPDRLYRQGAAGAGRISRESGVMRLAVMVNPYSHFDFEASAENLSEQARYTWTHGSPESLNMLEGAVEVGLEAGADTVMLLADDFVPHEGRNRKNYSLYTVEDKTRFVNLQTAQAYVINSLKQWIDNHYPGVRLEFCPPWYCNEFIIRSEGKAEVYFQELIRQIPRDIAIIWTGPTVRSLSIDAADFHRYRSLIERPPMLWDNTLYARNIETKIYGGYTSHYPGKVRMCNLFEPYDTDRPRGFHTDNDGRHMYTNGDAYSEVYKIKYATVADYEWNTAAYNPELSLWKALCRNYGTLCAKELLLFNDAYYGLYQICLRMDMEGPKEEFLRNGSVLLEDLNNCLARITERLSEKHPLVAELEAFRNRQKDWLKKFPFNTRNENPK